LGFKEKALFQNLICAQFADCAAAPALRDRTDTLERVFFRQLLFQLGCVAEMILGNWL
jgi:hypothetical protein